MGAGVTGASVGAGAGVGAGVGGAGVGGAGVGGGDGGVGGAGVGGTVGGAGVGASVVGAGVRGAGVGSMGVGGAVGQLRNSNQSGLKQSSHSVQQLQSEVLTPFLKLPSKHISHPSLWRSTKNSPPALSTTPACTAAGQISDQLAYWVVPYTSPHMLEPHPDGQSTKYVASSKKPLQLKYMLHSSWYGDVPSASRTTLESCATNSVNAVTQEGARK